MILPFSTQLNGKPTYFVEKILKGLYEYYCQDPNHVIPNSNSYNWLKVISDCLYESGKKLGYEYAEDILRKQDEVCPKLHTIRKDEKNRWKAGVLIDFFINTRTKDMFRFAPQVPVVSTQKINIFWIQDQKGNLTHSRLVQKRYNWVDVIIDGFILEVEQIKELAQNDGFDTVEEFFAYFNHDFSGKIIHWTDKKY